MLSLGRALVATDGLPSLQFEVLAVEQNLSLADLYRIAADSGLGGFAVGHRQHAVVRLSLPFRKRRIPHQAGAIGTSSIT